MPNGRRPSDKIIIIGSIAALVVVMIVFIIVLNIVMNFISSFVPLITGALLLLGNRRELIDLIRTRKPSPAVLNAMIGMALVLFGFGSAVGPLQVFFFIPAVVLLFLALPIALSKPEILATYRTWGSSVMGAFRRVAGGRSRTNSTVPGNFNTTVGQQTVQLDPTTINQPDAQRRP